MRQRHLHLSVSISKHKDHYMKHSLSCQGENSDNSDRGKQVIEVILLP
jgi:hypothetical protein